MAIPAFCFNLFEAKKPQKGFPLQSGAIENELNRKIVREKEKSKESKNQKKISENQLHHLNQRSISWLKESKTRTSFF